MSAPRRELRAACFAAIFAIYAGAALLFSPGSGPVGDEPALLHYANQVAHGVYAGSSANEPMAFLWHGPGLPALLAPLSALHVPLALMRLVGPLLAFLAILAFERLLQLWVSPGRAFAGACALALYAPFWVFLRSLHKEPLALLLMIGTVYLTTRYLREGRRMFGLGAGAVLALLVLTRLEFGTVLVVCLLGTGVWLLCRRNAVEPRRFGLVVVTALALCVPWLGYTYAKTHRPLYWGNAGGLSMYWMSTPASDELGDWHSTTQVFSDPNLAGHRSFFHSIERLPPFERDLAMQRAARSNIARHPLKYAQNVALNVSRLFFAMPRSFRGPPLVSLLYVLLAGPMLAALARLGLQCVRRRRRISPEAIPFLLLGGGAVAVHLPFSAEPRMLAPVLPLILCGLVCAAWPVRARVAAPARLRQQRHHARRTRASARDLQWEARDLEPARG